MQINNKLIKDKFINTKLLNLSTFYSPKWMHHIIDIMETVFGINDAVYTFY
jgi:hypothetical protein